MTPDQQHAVSAEENVLFVSAGAGSGKTSVLVERYVRFVVELGVPAGQVAAVTFTRKAAGELRHRIRARLLEMGRPDLAGSIDRAPIGTIHALCSRILRTDGLFLGLHPGFRVLDEDEAEILVRDALAAAWEEVAAQAGEAELEVLARHRSMLEEQVLVAFRSLRAAGRRVPQLRVPPSRDVCRERVQLDTALQGVRHLSPAALPNATAVSNHALACECIEWLATASSVDPVTICRAAAYVPAMRGDKAKALFGEQREALLEWCRAMGEDYLARVAAAAATLLDRFTTIYAALKAQRDALDFADLEIESISLLEGPKRRFPEPSYLLVDEFQDTNLVQCRLFDLLAPLSFTSVGDYFQSIYAFRGADCAVFRERRDRLQGGEGQGSHSGSTWVSDDGTSAYVSLSTNFRTAEPVLTVINRLFGHGAFFGSSYVPLLPCTSRRVDYQRGRSDPAVELHVVEADGSLDPGGSPSDLLQDAGGRLEDAAQNASADGGTTAGSTAARGGAAAHAAADASAEVAARVSAEASYVAARVRRLVEEEGWRPRQIAVLLRKTVRSGDYAQALQRLDVATYLVGGRGYFTQLEVSDVMSFLTLLLDPHDDLALAAALRSPLAGVSDDALWLLGRLRKEEGLVSLWAAACARESALLAARDETRLQRLCAVLQDLQGRVGSPGLSGLIDAAVSTLDFDLSLLAAPDGHRRFANVRKLMELADVFEEMEGPDLAGFLSHLRRRGGLGDRESEAAVLGEDEDVVRIMSVHQAKGLEFPVVIYAGLGDRVQEDSPGLLLGADGEMALRMSLPGKFSALDGRITLGPYERLLQAERERARAEEARICYVAATRARERLILVGSRAANLREVEKRPLTWFMSAVGLGADEEVPAAYRPWDQVDLVCNPGGGTFPCGVRSAGRSPDAPRTSPTPVAPPFFPSAAHSPAVAAVSFSALKLFHLCPRRYYLERVLGMQVGTSFAARGDSCAPRSVATGERPEGDACLASVREPDEDTEPQRLEMGIVVHKMLELAPMQPEAPDEQALQELQGAACSALGLDISRQAAEECRALCAAYWRSPFARPGWDTLGREVPFSFALGDWLVKGVLDRVMASRETWHVVDYKTNRLSGRFPVEAAAPYDLQVAIYGLLGLRRGADRVQVHLLFLETPEEPASVAYGPADRVALEDRLHREVAAVSAGRFHRVTDSCATCPHLWLCGA